MTSRHYFRWAVPTLLILSAVPTLALAQYEAPPAASANIVPRSDLSDHLRTLARSPRDLNALIGAGQSALSVGDATAALSFFGRANEVAPNDGRVKAGLGSTLLLLERPDDALRLFGEAVALGVPQSAIALDRGLAYDLRGDQLSAQRDYSLALRSDNSDELVRRNALSLGISGQKNEALTQLDPLLRKQDQAAWRARTFILAMNGDVRGATSITRTIMPQQAEAMAPFLRRLSSFTPAQRALAVTYGTMPEDSHATVPIPPSVIARVIAPVSPPVQVAIAKPVVIPAPAPRYETPKPVYVTAKPPLVAAPVPLPEQPKQVAILTKLKALPSPDDETPSAPVIEAAPTPVIATPVTPKTIIAPPPQPIERAVVYTPAVVVKQIPTAVAPPPVAVTAKPKFSIASLTDDLKPETQTPAAHVPTDSELRELRRAAKKKAEAKAKADAEIAAKKAKEEAKRAEVRKNAAREWVQVAGGNNRRGFEHTWQSLKDDHPDLFKGRTAYYTPLNHTYRILTGPFDSSSEARSFVNKMSKAGLSGFTFSSDAGQVVSRVGGREEPTSRDEKEPAEKPVKRKHRRR